MTIRASGIAIQEIMSKVSASTRGIGKSNMEQEMPRKLAIISGFKSNLIKPERGAQFIVAPRCWGKQQHQNGAQFYQRGHKTDHDSGHRKALFTIGAVDYRQGDINKITPKARLGKSTVHLGLMVS